MEHAERTRGERCDRGNDRINRAAAVRDRVGMQRKPIVEIAQLRGVVDGLIGDAHGGAQLGTALGDIVRLTIISLVAATASSFVACARTHASVSR